MLSRIEKAAVVYSGSISDMITSIELEIPRPTSALPMWKPYEPLGQTTLEYLTYKTVPSRYGVGRKT